MTGFALGNFWPIEPRLQQFHGHRQGTVEWQERPEQVFLSGGTQAVLAPPRQSDFLAITAAS
jgi:hypothetical protein